MDSVRSQYEEAKPSGEMERCMDYASENYSEPSSNTGGVDSNYANNAGDLQLLGDKIANACHNTAEKIKGLFKGAQTDDNNAGMANSNRTVNERISESAKDAMRSAEKAWQRSENAGNQQPAEEDAHRRHKLYSGCFDEANAHSAKEAHDQIVLNEH